MFSYLLFVSPFFPISLNENTIQLIKAENPVVTLAVLPTSHIEFFTKDFLSIAFLGFISISYFIHTS